MKLDVLHVVPALAPGGAEHVVTQLLLDAGRLRGRSGAVCLGAPQGTRLERALERGGVPLWHLDKRPGADLRCALRLERLVARAGARVLHTHQHALPYALPALAARRGLRGVHTVHNLAQHEVPRMTQWLHRAAFRLGVLPVAVGQAVRASLRALYGLRRVPLVPNGIPLARFEQAGTLRAAARAALGLPDDAVAILCPARLAPQKGHALLLDAFAIGPGAEPQAHLLLAGDGPLRAGLEARVREQGLARVHFLGDREDTPALLAAADIAVLASHWEGQPLALMEAMAAGLPVVATNVGGVAEIVRPRETGLLVPRGSSVALAAALERLLFDAPLRRRYGEAARQLALRSFDGRIMARRYQRLYDQLLRQPAALATAHA